MTIIGLIIAWCLVASIFACLVARRLRELRQRMERLEARALAVRAAEGEA